MAKYLNALHEYVQGEEWKQSVQQFVAENHQSFADISPGKKSHEQYEMYRMFQEICEIILDNSLTEVNGSINKLERALDEAKAKGLKSPPDHIVNLVRDKLRCYSDFNEFAKMMQNAHNAFDPDYEDTSPAAPSSGSNGGWQELFDEATGSPYYWNSISNEVHPRISTFYLLSRLWISIPISQLYLFRCIRLFSAL